VNDFTIFTFRQEYFNTTNLKSSFLVVADHYIDT